MADLTLFQVLDEIERKNYFIWDQLNASERKQFYPVVLLKWMAGSGVDPCKLQRINTHFFAKPPKDQFLLLATAGAQGNKRWKWVAKKASPVEKELAAIQYVYNTNLRQAQQTIPLLSTQELEDVVKEYNDSLDKKETKKSRR